MINFLANNNNQSSSYKKAIWLLFSTIIIILIAMYIVRANLHLEIRAQMSNIVYLQQEVETLQQQLERYDDPLEKHRLDVPASLETIHQPLDIIEQMSNKYIIINYAKAEDIIALIEQHKQGLISEQATISVDKRTNAVLIQDQPEKLDILEEFIKSIDQPLRQVLIEARIVIVDDSFKEELGVKYNNIRYQQGNPSITGKSPLSASSAGASIPALIWGKLDKNILLDLELAAVQQEGRGEIISAPSLLTGHQQTAYIRAGEEIPYEQSIGNGVTSIAFKQAVLGLEVTPQITPNNEVIVDLIVSQDSRGNAVDGRVPAINTQKIATRVLVNDGETLVLGGIIKKRQREQVQRVPFLGAVPILGLLFQHRLIENSHEELLIFLTPRII